VAARDEQPAECTGAVSGKSFVAACSDNPQMAQGKRISAEISGDALQAIKDMGAAARLARTSAGDGQAAAAARLGVHVQTIARIESGEPGVAIGHVLGMLALYGIAAKLQPRDGARLAPGAE
jgi:HTH-type transcriptional regulator/antitoxin HipB